MKTLITLIISLLLCGIFWYLLYQHGGLRAVGEGLGLMLVALAFATLIK